MKRIKVYSIDHCAYCDAAKSLLRQMNLDFEEININDNDELRIKLVQETGHRTMPQIFIDQEFIGGFLELKQYLERNPQA